MVLFLIMVLFVVYVVAFEAKVLCSCHNSHFIVEEDKKLHLDFTHMHDFQKALVPLQGGGGGVLKLYLFSLSL